MENLAEFYPEASWQRCVVHFYRNVWTAVPTGKVRVVAAMLKAIHAVIANLEHFTDYCRVSNGSRNQAVAFAGVISGSSALMA